MPATGSRRASFALRARLDAPDAPPLAGLVLWALVNGYAGVRRLSPTCRSSRWSLGLRRRRRGGGDRGAARAADWSSAIRYCGENSIVIYLAFFLPMAATRTVLLKTGVIADLGTVSLLVTAAGVVGPLLLFWLVRDTPLSFLFKRPEALRTAPALRAALQPAE